MDIKGKPSQKKTQKLSNLFAPNLSDPALPTEKRPVRKPN